MAYASVHSQPGSAERNAVPITNALSGLLDASVPSADGKPRQILFEIASGAYYHIRSWAEKWDRDQWFGSVRDERQLRSVKDTVQSAPLPCNLHLPVILDIERADHWRELERRARSGELPNEFDGVLMVNLVHCCPNQAPEAVFRAFSPRNKVGGGLTARWIAAYSPWLQDDGTFKSESDAEFDKSYIKGHHESLGLRTIPSVTAQAELWGFKGAQRIDMPAGNTFVVWRADV